MTEKLLLSILNRMQQSVYRLKRMHEQEVAVYDLLDENQFDLREQTGPYHLHLKTDLRHVYFDVRDQKETALSGCNGTWPVPADHA